MATKAPDPLVLQLDMIRARRGLTMGTWAELAGVSRQTLYRALGGDGSVNFGTIRSLASVLDVTLGIELPKPEPLD